MSKFSNRRSHFRHLGPVLAGFESGSKGGNGGSPLRGINTADYCVELLAVWGLSGAWFSGSPGILKLQCKSFISISLSCLFFACTHYILDFIILVATFVFRLFLLRINVFYNYANYINYVNYT